MSQFNASEILKEVKYSSSRSGGKGGQHANKTETRVELYFDVCASALLREEEKERVRKKLAGRMSREGVLRLEADDTRSQAMNKALVTARFLALLEEALKKEKPRRKTKIPRAAREQRLKSKKIRGEIKKGRQEGRNFHGREE